MKNPFLTEASENVDDWETFGKEVMKSMGYTKKGNETVNGKNCEVWEGQAGKIWIYKSYSIKTTTNTMGIKATQLATKFEAGSTVNNSEFELPKNITFKDVGDQFKVNENDDEESKKTKKMMKDLFEGF